MINNFVDSCRPPIEVIGWCDSFSDLWLISELVKLIQDAKVAKEGPGTIMLLSKWY